MNKDTTMSHHLLSMSLSGFNHRAVPYEEKSRFFASYWENIIDIFNNRGRAYGKAFWFIGKPKYDDDGKEIITKLEELMSKQDQFDGFWKKNISLTLDGCKKNHMIKKFAMSDYENC